MRRSPRQSGASSRPYSRPGRLASARRHAPQARRSRRAAARRALKEISGRSLRAEAACWVAPWFRGRRFAARSLRLAAAHAFAQGLLRIHAECETDNVAGIRSVLAAGMRHEGTLRAWYVTATGQALDQHVFGLLPEDLEAAPALPLR